MNVPILAIVKNAAGGWVYTWPNLGAAYYRVILWGIQLANQTSLTYTYNGQAFRTFPPPLEIAFEDQKVLSEKFQARLLIQWHGTPTAFEYQIQQYDPIAAQWDNVTTVKENGSWIYNFQSAVLTDESTIQFRVMAINRVGQVSAPQNFQKFIVCPPKPPDSQIQIGYTGSEISILPL